MTRDRFALLIGSYVYPNETTLAELRGPANDIAALEDVLSDPAVGAFSTQKSINEPSATVIERLEGFLSDRKREDTALLYFSGHGIKAVNGELYFAMANTRLDRLRATALRARDVHELLHASSARRQLLVLDCCYSGAFARGLVIRAGDSVGTLDHFDGGGHAVLTASDAIQYAFEDGHTHSINHAVPQSVFTRVLVEGLRSGDADVDRDGVVTIDELYEYIHDNVRRRNPSQTPRKWALDQQGKSIVAYVPSRSRKAAALPVDVVEALADLRPFVRKSAVEQLETLLAGAHPGLSIAAREMLERVAIDDDSKAVSAAAVRTLQRYQSTNLSIENSTSFGQVGRDLGRQGHDDATVSQPTPPPGSNTESAAHAAAFAGEPSQSFSRVNDSGRRESSPEHTGASTLRLHFPDGVVGGTAAEMRFGASDSGAYSETIEQSTPFTLFDKPPATSSLLTFAIMACGSLTFAAFPSYSLGSLVGLSTRDRSYLVFWVAFYSFVCLLCGLVHLKHKSIGWLHLPVLVVVTALSVVFYLLVLLVS